MLLNKYFALQNLSYKCFVIEIKKFGIHYEIQENNKSFYLFHAICLSQLIFLLDLKNIFSVLFIEFDPMFILLMYLNRNNKIETQNTSINSEITNNFKNNKLINFTSINNKNTLESLSNNAFNNNKLLFSIDINALFNKKLDEFLNVSQNKLDNIEIILDDNKKIPLRIYKDSNNISHAFKELCNVPNANHCISYEYNSCFKKYNNHTFFFKYKDFFMKITDLSYHDKIFNININLDSLTVLSRIVIGIAILKLVSKSNFLYMFKINILMHIFHLYTSQIKLSDLFEMNGKKTYAIYTISSKNKEYFSKTSMSLSDFNVFYGFAFNKIGIGEYSKEIISNGKKVVLTIVDIQTKKPEQFVFRPEIQQIFSKIIQDLHQEIQEIIKNSDIYEIESDTIKKPIDSFNFLNGITEELYKMIKLSIVSIMNQNKA